MPHPETTPLSDDKLRAIEAEFHARPDYTPTQSSPALITMPSELEFQRRAAEREAREVVEQERRAVATREWLEQQKREKRNGRLKKAMAVAAVVLAFKSGGAVDMAGDHFSDAGSVASEAVPVPHLDDYLPDRMDNISFEDYSSEAQDEMKAEAEESMERDARARDTVIDLFEAVDKAGYDELKVEVAKERAEHPELYMSEERTKQIIENIENSDSNNDAIKVLDEFLDFYGIEAGFRDDRAFDDQAEEVREITRAWVDVLGGLPKDFVALSQVERVTISHTPVTDLSESGTEMGTYSHDSNKINLVAMSKLMNVTAPVEGFLERSDFTYQGVIAHELGHALDEQLPIGAPLPENEQADAPSVGLVLEHIGRGIVNRPEAPSLYAHTSDEEYSAELLSGVLSDRSDGLASTDEWRKFSSTSNKKMINMLAQLEALRPGIAKILIANRA